MVNLQVEHFYLLMLVLSLCAGMAGARINGNAEYPNKNIFDGLLMGLVVGMIVGFNMLEMNYSQAQILTGVGVGAVLAPQVLSMIKNKGLDIISPLLDKFKK